MDFENKKQRAFEFIREKGMQERCYAPPLYRWCWRKGVKIPPPLFAPFWLNVLIFGLTFGVMWGAIMWLLAWHHQETALHVALVNTLLAGGFYGIIMALLYFGQKKAKRLPDWKNIDK